jgi:DNA-binding IclR family transcriptional regulator
MSQSSDQLSTTAIRTIRVLKAFTDEQPALRFSDLMAATQLPKSTLVRFLNTLESEGFIAHDRRSGYYRLGLELIVLGERALRQTQVHQAALPLLEQLAEASGETVDLEILSCREVITLASIPGRHVLGTGRFVGKRWPAHATATGKLVLAYLPPEQIETFLAGPLESLTQFTRIEPEVFRLELEKIRSQGYAISREELELHLVAVAGPVRNAHGEVIAAVSISGPQVRLQEDRLAEYIKMVQETCAEVSRLMGYVES